MPLDFKDQVVIVTGGGGGLGGAYSRFFGSRGARVLVNDFSKDNANKITEEIKSGGKGDALANYDDVNEGDKIVKAAFDKWGRVDVIINNAGILRDKSFKAMTEKEWDQVHQVHVRGAYKVTKAAWPIFRKQKFGRIINTASAAGLYGNFGQTNYSSAKMALVTFSKTLAREGEKYNITANTIAPIAASQMTATIMPPEMLAILKPEMVVPLVAYLVNKETKVSGEVFEVGAGWMGKIRWERSTGVVFKTDDSYTPSAIAARWDEVKDYSNPTYPTSMADVDHQSNMKKSKSAETNKQSDAPVDFKGKTAVVTGAGAGLGRAYALMFAKGGANVVVNDVSKENAEKTVEEIKKAGGSAVANTDSVTEGEKVIKTAIDAFGAVHILVNNAGILRDKSFTAMTDAEWDLVYSVHLKGTYSCTKAAWPHFLAQKYGRIVNATSVVALFGNFGQANYSTAKAAILGFSKALSVEGKKYGILVNTLVPNAGTAMTATIWPEEMVKAFQPAFVAPVVGFLSSEANKDTNMIVESMGGWVAVDRWQRSAGYGFNPNRPLGPEDVAAKWEDITRFDENAIYPNTPAEATGAIMANATQMNESDEGSSSSASDDFASLDTVDPEDSDLVKQAKRSAIDDTQYEYTERDVMLYNLGIGATEKQLKYVFENAEDFQALPTFGVIPQFKALFTVDYSWLPNFSPMMLLHGEQFLEIKKFPIPTGARLVNKTKLLEALDKGKAAACTTLTKTFDADSGEEIFSSQSTVFIRGSGGFGGKKNGKDRGPATAAYVPPKRNPDKVVEEKTLESQAAIYRLSGDYNPLHIDPSFSKVGGFPQPILHGLCTMGIAGKHVYEAYGPYKDIKVRFSGVVFPGETVVTEMWKEGNKVIFTAKIKERKGTQVLANAGATLVES
ncbi:NAD(P)-binding protein [Atractiella rhizophila]|nr:NAD(P)-binding protein [Atractiella rhizophila]